jgi:hypothetical protein
MDQTIENLIKDDFKRELETIVKSKHRMYKAYIISEYFEQLFLFSAAILVFANGFFPYKILAFSSGVCTVLVYAMKRLSINFRNEFDERNRTIKESLKTIGIKNIPEIIIAEENESNI